MIIGSHVSFKSDTQLIGSVNEALSYGANAFMFYTGAPQNTVRKDIEDYKTEEALKLIENVIDKNNIIVHAPYIINLANGNEFAHQFLQLEIDRLVQLGLDKLVLHPGSAVKLPKEEAMSNIINGLNKIDNKGVTILLETMAGKGTEIGRNFEELKEIIDNTKYELGVCLDTCHLNDAGYDLNNFDQILDQFDKTIGLKYIKCIHINDSKNDLGMKKDRHENFGFGTIGYDNLINIIYNEKLKNVPKILETPYIKGTKKSYPPYKFEIDMILKKEFNENLINDVKSYYNDL